MKILKLITVSAVICFMLALTACDGAGDNSGESAEWEYFRSVNDIGCTFEEISDESGPLEDNGCRDGGITFYSQSEELSYGFPKYSEDEMNENDRCTSMYGTAEMIFGITESMDISSLENNLKTEFDEYEGGYCALKNSTIGSYYINLYIDYYSTTEIQPTTEIGISANGDSLYDSTTVPENSEISIDYMDVDSSVFSKIGHDEDKEVLAVVFEDSGACYYYYGVPEFVYDDFKNADSYGSYYSENIKGKYYSIKQ